MKKIAFSGGEPTLRKDLLVSGIKEANKQGKYTYLFTNGYWAYNSKNAEIICNELNEAGLKEIIISDDNYHFEEIKEKTRDVGDPLKVIFNNVKNFFAGGVNPYSWEGGKKYNTLSIGRAKTLNLKVKGTVGQSCIKKIGHYDFTDLFLIEGIHIYTNGEVSSCCWGPVNPVGNVSNECLENIIKKIILDPFWVFVNSNSLNYSLCIEKINEIGKKYFKNFELDTNYPCVTCHDFFINKENSNILKQELRKNKDVIDIIKSREKTLC